MTMYMMTMPPGQHIPFKVDAGDPVVVSVTHKGQRYKLRLQMSILGVVVVAGDGPGGMPNFVVQSGNVMSIEKDAGAS